LPRLSQQFIWCDAQSFRQLDLHRIAGSATEPGSLRRFEGCDLAGREPWEGVVLSEAETWDAIDRLSHFFDETAGYTAGRLLHKGTKRGDEPDEGGSDE
jgi:hypothetical protein